MQDIKSLDRHAPLHEVIGVIAAFWAAAITGYHLIFPYFGYSLDYNVSTIPIAAYFCAWALVSIWYFWRLFSSWVLNNWHIGLYVVLSLCSAVFIISLIQLLSFFPPLRGQAIAPYTDLLFVTPWYFIPKAFEVLMQQILITTLVLELYSRFQNFRDTLLGYAVCFVGAHIALFALTSAPAAYSLAITAWAAISTAIFPYLLLRVRGGFVYTYAIHLSSYAILAMLLRTLPPLGYFGI